MRSSRSGVSSSPSRLLLLLALLAAILATSASSIFIRYAQRDVPSLVIAALRLTFASLALAPLALGRYRSELRGVSRSDLGFGLLGGLFLALHFATWISSLEHTTVASSVVIVSTGPLWVALVSPWLLHEKLSRAALIGLCLALIGGGIIAAGDVCTWRDGLECPSLADSRQGRGMWGNFLALAGAWGVSGYLVIGRNLRARMSLIPYVFVVYGAAALALLLLAWIAQLPITGYPASAYGWIALMALVPQLIGHSIYNWALGYLPASMVATSSLVEPIGSATLAYFLLEERPPASTLIGAALILLGIYLSTGAGPAPNRAAASPPEASFE